VKRLALFWLYCAAIGFGVAAGVAVALCVALDGPAAWRAPVKAIQTQIVQAQAGR
jgi:hypothetical protein